MELKLNDELKNQLKTALRVNDAQKARRALAILALHFGADHDTVASVFNKSTSWARNLADNFSQKGVDSINVKTSPGRPPRYSEDQRKTVCEIRAKHPEWPLHKVQEESNKTLKTKMSLPTVRTIVLQGGFKFSTKRTWKAE